VGAFGTKNGARSLVEMRSRIERYRRQASTRFEDFTIGCILLEEPFFLPRELWIRVPPDWAPNIVRGKGYDTGTEAGLSLWAAVRERVPSSLRSGRSSARLPPHATGRRP